MLKLLNQIDSLVWGPPLLILLVGTGLYLTLRLRLLQVSRLSRAFRLIFVSGEDHHGDVSSFAALCTALAATVGTGNIIGVATAIKVGGPGALFWMWLAAFFGMATKYAEGLLAIKYRSKDAHGAVAGGPMHYILLGMGEKWRPLAIFFGDWNLHTGEFHYRSYAEYHSAASSCDCLYLGYFGGSSYF